VGSAWEALAAQGLVVFALLIFAAHGAGVMIGRWHQAGTEQMVAAASFVTGRHRLKRNGRCKKENQARGLRRPMINSPMRQWASPKGEGDRPRIGAQRTRAKFSESIRQPNGDSGATSGSPPRCSRQVNRFADSGASATRSRASNAGRGQKPTQSEHGGHG
jgi:hypothetical protein